MGWGAGNEAKSYENRIISQYENTKNVRYDSLDHEYDGRMQGRWRTGILALSVALLLSGCFELTADSKFKDDGTAEVVVEFGVSAQLLALAQIKPGEKGMFDSCGAIQRMDEAPKGMRILSTTRGSKGDLITCKGVVVFDDPVAAVGDFKREVKDSDPLVVDTFKLTRLGSNGYRLLAVIEAGPKAQAAPPEGKSGPEVLGTAMAVAMTANRYITFSVTGERIENSTGEMSNDGRTTTWRLPVSLLMVPVTGFRQEIKADIIYRESWIDKARRLIGLH